MSRIRELIREIHRRSLWQVLLIYLGASWAALEAVDFIAGRLLLPDWIPGLAIVLVIVGLPVVLGTAIVQEGAIRPSAEPAPDTVARAPTSRSTEREPSSQEPHTEVRRGPRAKPPTSETGPPDLRRLLTWRHALQAGVAAFALWGVLVTGWLLFAGPGEADTEMPTSGSAIAVIPPAPPVPDTTLQRLGRELTITLSSNLDGVADLRAADPLSVLALVDRAGDAPTLEAAANLARRLRAGHLLRGTLVGSGEQIRADIGLYRTDDLQPIARAVVTVPSRQITVLTDSITLALLRELGRTGDVPTPSPRAITTRSLPALRAYLEGEQAIAEDRWRDADDAFARAIEADSTFWFAYWRYHVARSYWGLPVDSAITAAIIEHRTEFPERDRLLIESRMAPTLSEQAERVRAVTMRFPDYWPAWFERVERLVHSTPYLGSTYSDSREAAERTVALNPDFLTGWEHLIWITLLQRDSIASARALAQMHRLEADSSAIAGSGLPITPLYEYVLALMRTRDEPDSVHAASGARMIAGYRGRIPHERLLLGLSLYGYHRAVIDLTERVRQATDRPEVRAATRYASSIAWASRGAWDSAVVAADRYFSATTTPAASLHAYRIATIGAWLGALPPDEAETRRRRARSTLKRPSGPQHAELAWLDGLVAYSRDDADAIAATREDLASDSAGFSQVLARSLGALELGLRGDPSAGADSLEELALESAERSRQFGYGTQHPYLDGVNRITAARWLLSVGDTTRAERLLTWYEAVFPSRLGELASANRALEALAHFERARIEEARGRTDRAIWHYREFLSRYDAPVPALEPFVEAGRAGLRRLSAAR